MVKMDQNAMKRVSRGTTKSSQTVSRPPLLIMLTRMQFCGRQNTALRPWRTKDDHSRGHATYVIFYRTRVRDWCHLTLFCIVSQWHTNTTMITLMMMTLQWLRGGHHHS